MTCTAMKKGFYKVGDVWYYDKDPDAQIDLGLNWTKFLKGGVLTNSTWVTPADITVDHPTMFPAGNTFARFSGGTVGVAYKVTNRIQAVTADGIPIVDDLTFVINVTEN